MLSGVVCLVFLYIRVLELTNDRCSMLAVMTMNVGYFIAVLTGTFLGSLVVGRYNTLVEGGH